MVWSFGLFPFMQHVSMSVKPQLLSIYENYYLALGPEIQPSAKAFILALSPSMEEEGNEYFNSAIKIMDELKRIIGNDRFYQSLFLAATGSPNSRLSLVNYLSKKRFPDSSGESKNKYRGFSSTMVVALAQMLTDDNLLVQRGVLELIVQNMPLNNKVLTSDEYVVLMKSSLAVVLRREVSLNRRLFAWITGHNEDYWQKYGLSCVLNAVNMMLKVKSDVISDVVMPYKILISLMDKPEIGYPLMDKIFTKSLINLKRRMHMNRNEHEIEEIRQTANILVDTLDPSYFWSKIFSNLWAELFEPCFNKPREKEKLEILSVIDWFVGIVKFRDSESSSFHIPVMIVIITISLHSLDINEEYDIKLGNTLLHAQKTFLKKIRKPLLKLRRAQVDLNHEKLIQIAKLSQKFYNISSAEQKAGENSILPVDLEEFLPENFVHILVIASSNSIFQLLRKLETSGNPLKDDSKKFLIGLMDSFLTLFDRTTKIKPPSAPRGYISTEIVASMTEWAINGDYEISKKNLQILLTGLDFSFFVKSSISLEAVTAILDRLWKRLNDRLMEDHEFVVSTTWRLWKYWPNKIVGRICSYIHDSNYSKRVDNLEKFSVFWRISGNGPEEYLAFSRPIFIILSYITSKDPTLVRISQTFMKCSIKSLYLLAEPLVASILDTEIRLEHDKTRGNILYSNNFSSRKLVHNINLLIEVIKYGGSSLISNLNVTRIQSSKIFPLMRTIVGSGFEIFEVNLENISHYEFMLFLGLLFVICDMNPAEISLDQHIEEDIKRIQFVSSGLLQYLLAHSTHIDFETLGKINHHCLSRLKKCVKNGWKDIQPRLLAIIHASLSVYMRASSSGIKSSQSSVRRSLTINEQQLTNTLVEGIVSESNKEIVPYYIDFISSSMSAFSENPSPFFFPLVDCLVAQTQRCFCYLTSDTGNERFHLSNDLNIISILDGIEKLMEFSSKQAEWQSEDFLFEEDTSSNELSAMRGITDLMSGVFVGSDSSNIALGKRSKLSEIISDQISRTVQHCQQIWRACSKMPEKSPREKVSSHFERIKVRIRRLFDSFIGLERLEVMEALVIGFQSQNYSFRIDNEWEKMDFTAFDIIQELKWFSPLSLIESLCQIIHQRQVNYASRQKIRISLSLKPLALETYDFFQFMEAFLRDFLDEVSDIISLADPIIKITRELQQSSNLFQKCSFRLLRIFTLLGKKLSDRIDEDKKLKREFNDLYPKTLEFCIHLLNSLVEHPHKWKDSTIESSDYIVRYLGNQFLQDLAQLPIESDKLGTVFTHLVQNLIVNPAKIKSPMYNSVVWLWGILSRNSFSMKYWRKDFWELYGDAKFFDMDFESCRLWIPIVKAIANSEKDRLDEYLGRLGAPPAGIFVSKDAEIKSKYQLLKKIGLLIISADFDNFLPQLPSIQEKLVDIFKSPYNIAHAEAYLLLRVLFVKMTLKNLLTMWPGILTEILRLFNFIINSENSVSREVLQVLVAVLKLIDFLLLLSPQEFQLHSWVFVDDFDLISSDDNFVSLIESLRRKASGSSPSNFEFNSELMKSSQTPAKMLLFPAEINFQSIQKLQDLAPFLENFSKLHIYQEYQVNLNYHYAIASSNKGLPPERHNESNLDPRIINENNVYNAIIADYAEKIV